MSLSTPNDNTSNSKGEGAIPDVQQIFGEAGDAVSANPAILYKEGTVAATCKRFVWELHPEYRKSNCYRCAVNPALLNTTLRCSGCKWAHYCSKECQKEDWQDRHKAECVLLRQEYIQLLSSSKCLTFAILFYKTILHLKEEGPDCYFYRLPLDKVASLHDMIDKYDDEGNRQLLRILDPDGTVCPDKETFGNILLRVFNNFYGLNGHHYVTRSRAMYKDSGNDTGIGGIVLVFSEQVKFSCVANTILRDFGNCMPKTNIFEFVATRDIYVGEEISFPINNLILSKALRNEMYKREGIVCSCKVCTDPSVEPERTALKCKNERCSEPIPSDQRALKPCPSCGESLSKAHLKKAQSLIKQLEKFFDPRQTDHHDDDISTSFIREGEKLLHPSNLLLGMLYFFGHAKPKLPRGLFSEEKIGWLKKALPIFEKYTSKYSHFPRVTCVIIVRNYMMTGEFGQAIPYAKQLLERGKIWPGAGSTTDRFQEQLWSHLMVKPPFVDEELLKALYKEEDQVDFCPFGI